MGGSPRYRMIAIDLDGTLLSPTGQVSERSRSAVHAALSAGLLICFATGRNWTESRAVLEAVAHYDTAVFVGGAMVIDTKKEVTLHRTMVDPSLAAEVSGALEQLGHAVLALQDTGTAGVDYLISADVELDEHTTRWMAVTKSKVQRIEKLSLHSHEHTIRLGVVGDPPRVRATRQVLDEKFGDRLVLQNLFLPTSGVEILEIFDPAVNKWEGILHVARRHAIEPQQIVAIGDDMNDLPMLRHAGLGVAMGNGRDEAKAVAKRIIGTNADDGLAAFLEELVAMHTVEPMNEQNAERGMK